MTVYNLYIFNREGQCIYYKEWNRTKQSGLSQEQEFKQMFGFIIEMKAFVNKMSPGDL
jgi:trafficking protein particle complex subunit 1